MRLSVHLATSATQSLLYFVRATDGLQVILQPVPMFSRSKLMSVLEYVALDCEDEGIICDLREMNEGRPEKYSVFWSHC